MHLLIIYQITKFEGRSKVQKWINYLMVQLFNYLFENSSCVTESGVRLLPAQKPIKRQGWWKGKFALFPRPATGGWAGGGGGDVCARPAPPATLTIRGQELSFMDGARWLRAETAQSALTVILKSVIGGLTSVILIVLSTVNLQFQGRFVSISLRPILGTVAACVTATAWSSCS